MAQRSTQAARAPWAKVLSALGTLVAVVFVGFFDMGVAAIPPVEILSPASYTWHMIGLFIAAPAAALLMILRISKPELTLMASSALVFLFPISPFGPAIALTWVMAREPRRAWTWAIPLGAFATAVPAWRDWHWKGLGSIFVTTEAVSEPLGGGSYIMMWLVLMALSLAGGWIRYYRSRASAESEAAAAHRAQAEYFQSELGRQEERDLIAREMHDTVAHHLSIVSLHAGALEVTTTDENVPQVARAVRESAHLALEEMRSLITSLRDSAGEGYAGAAPQLSEWEDLVAAAQTAGVEITTDVQVQTQGMPPALARAAYRILQESVTNATKHAPGSGVSIQMWGGPQEGVSIAVANWLPNPDSAFRPSGNGVSRPVTGSGMGVLGMTERARALGGTLSAGPDGNHWLVKAWMPWT